MEELPTIDGGVKEVWISVLSKDAQDVGDVMSDSSSH